MPNTPLNLYSHLFILPLLLVLITSLLSYFGGYQNPIERNLTGYAGSIFKTLVVAIGIMLGLLFFLKIEYISRFVILVFAVLELGTVFVIRVIYSNNFKEQVRGGKKMGIQIKRCVCLKKKISGIKRNDECNNGKQKVQPEKQTV